MWGYSALWTFSSSWSTESRLVFCEYDGNLTNSLINIVKKWHLSNVTWRVIWEYIDRSVLSGVHCLKINCITVKCSFHRFMRCILSNLLWLIIFVRCVFFFTCSEYMQWPGEVLDHMTVCTDGEVFIGCLSAIHCPSVNEFVSYSEITVSLQKLQGQTWSNLR